MPQMKVVLDFDDFRENENALDLLFRMRANWPKFKVNLYTIPMQCSRAFLNEVSRLDWVEMHVHGWEHTKLECRDWKEHQAANFMKTALEWKNCDGKNVFANGFKAPGWGLNQATVNALRSMNTIVGLNNDTGAYQDVTIPPDMKAYYPNGTKVTLDHPCWDWVREHGHLNVLDCTNDLRLTFHHLKDKLPQDAKFYFITEVIEELYGKS